MPSKIQHILKNANQYYPKLIISLVIENGVIYNLTKDGKMGIIDIAFNFSEDLASVVIYNVKAKKNDKNK